MYLLLLWTSYTTSSSVFTAAVDELHDLFKWTSYTTCSSERLNQVPWGLSKLLIR